MFGEKVLDMVVCGELYVSGKARGKRDVGRVGEGANPFSPPNKVIFTGPLTNRRVNPMATEVAGPSVLGDAKLSKSDRITDWRVKWADLELEEKVERCRKQIKDQAFAIGEMQRQLQMYEEHVHQDETGKIFFPMYALRGYGEAGLVEEDGREWF